MDELVGCPIMYAELVLTWGVYFYLWVGNLGPFWRVWVDGRGHLFLYQCHQWINIFWGKQLNLHTWSGLGVYGRPLHRRRRESSRIPPPTLNQYLKPSSTDAHYNDINGLDDQYIGATAVLDLLLNLDTSTNYYFRPATNATPSSTLFSNR